MQARQRSNGPIDRTVVVKAEGVPEGSRFKGYANFDVQDLVIKTEVVRYRIEQWLTPEGKLLSGQMPKSASADGGHFGGVLVCFVLHQYYHALVTEPLLLTLLRELGVRMSARSGGCIGSSSSTRPRRRPRPALRSTSASMSCARPRPASPL